MVAMTRTEITLTVTFQGETHDVAFHSEFGEDRIWNHDAFACRIGRGVKVYRASVMGVRVEGMHPNTRKGYGRGSAPIITDADGVEWGINLANTTVRNRQAFIVGWAEKFAGTETANKYNDYSALRTGGQA